MNYDKIISVHFEFHGINFHFEPSLKTVKVHRFVFYYCYHHEQTLCFISGKSIFWSEKKCLIASCQANREPFTYNVICGIRLKKTSTAFTMSIQDSSSNMQEQLSWGYENTPLHIVPTLRLLLD